VNQDHLEQEMAELMGVMHGAMQAFQHSVDELIDVQKSQAKTLKEDVSGALVLLNNVEKHSVSMLEAQKKSLEFINKRWADGLLEKAQEAGQAQARLFGQVVAAEALKEIKQELAVATKKAFDSAAALEASARHDKLNRLVSSLGLITCVTALVIFGLYFVLPDPADIKKSREDIAELEATIAKLEKRGGRMELSNCGAKKKLCVRVDQATSYEGGYMIIHGAK
jgi:hypothetical protein